MPDYGLTPEGLVIKDLPTIIQEKQEEIIAGFGDSANVEPESVFGQNINLSADRENELWLLLEQIYLAQYPNTASEGALDQAVSLNGIQRNGASFSTIQQQGFWGTVGTVIPAGTILSVDGDSDSKYALNDPLTLGAGVNQEQDISFSPLPTFGTWTIKFKGETTDPISFDASAADLKAALELLPSIDGVTVTGDYTTSFQITFDGENVEYRKNPLLTLNTSNLLEGATVVVPTVIISVSGVYQGEGTMTALVGGSATRANQYTLTVLDSAIAGVDRTSNEQEATSGSDVETDAELKIRRENSLSAFGGGTEGAVTAAVLNIDAVASCLVYENDSIATDPFGRPGKSFETFVLQKTEIGGGSPDPTVDQLVGETIFQNKPLGIETYGDGSVPNIFVVDTGGNQKIVKFSRPAGIAIYLTWDLITDPAIFPVDGATLIGNAVKEYGNALGAGNDVIVNPYLMEVLSAFQGITDVVTKIGTTPSPTTDDNIVIDDGAGGAVEISVWLPINIQFTINGILFIYNPVTEVWEA